jgi:hypothetical protein
MMACLRICARRCDRPAAGDLASTTATCGTRWGAAAAGRCPPQRPGVGGAERAVVVGAWPPAAMGWENCHMHVFADGRTRYGVPDPELRFGDERNATLPDLLPREWLGLENQRTSTPPGSRSSRRTGHSRRDPIRVLTAGPCFRRSSAGGSIECEGVAQRLVERGQLVAFECAETAVQPGERHELDGVAVGDNGMP